MFVPFLPSIRNLDIAELFLVSFGGLFFSDSGRRELVSNENRALIIAEFPRATEKIQQKSQVERQLWAAALRECAALADEKDAADAQRFRDFADQIDDAKQEKDV